MSRSSEFYTFFRELRIVDQRNYYEARRNEYGRAHRQAILVRNALLFAAALAGAIGQFTDGTTRAALAVAAGVFGALAAALTGYESLIGFAQLEKLYGDAAINLAEADLDWADADPEGDVTAEFERVENIFRDENGQWGQLTVESAATLRDTKRGSEGSGGAGSGGASHAGASGASASGGATGSGATPP